MINTYLQEALMTARKNSAVPAAGLAFILFLGFFYICIPAPVYKWFKGNLHTHTIFSDGDSSPEDVISWYKRHGYQFLAITDHNTITNPQNYRYMCDESFILIAGNEISDRAEGKPVHLLALGLHDASLSPAGGQSILQTLQNNVTAIRSAGAVPVICHPNFGWAFGAEEMLPLRDVTLFEVLNAHPSVNNLGGGGRPGTEVIWDTLLTKDRIFYGVGTDDMHRLASYPGKSWVMVRAAELTERAVLDSLEKGRFYVSTGVTLESYTVSSREISMKIKEAGDSQFTTWFIGRDGKILKTDYSIEPAYSLSGQEDEAYIRVKIQNSNGKTALIQPVFTNR